MPATALIGILTVSDRASRGDYADEGGPAIREYLADVLASPWEPRERIVPDEFDTVTLAIRDLAAAGCCLIVTTGGTGPSLRYVPTAILSRQTAGVCGRALVVNLPGRPRSIRQCLDAVFPAIPYCVDLIHTDISDPPRLETDPERLQAFRPG
jgi:molybdopterin adenylyltransferase